MNEIKNRGLLSFFVFFYQKAKKKSFAHPGRLQSSKLISVLQMRGVNVLSFILK